uniref:ABC transporter n=1 Tax=Siphoviridae sp. ctDmQ3 TaxID=2823570 RepID=A0A8S5L838_9CAUD|nr:MAG TPA: ABC transporter [Siphoviridae sp. ctDmQ3]
MSGKYMKIKRVIIPTLTMVMLSSMLFGCASATKQDTYNMLQESTEIELEYAVPDYDNAEDSKVELLPWLQLSSLETHPELRKAFEELLGVTVSEDGTKTGIIYTDETGNANQNNTLFNALGSTNLFIDTIRDTEKLEKIESIASDNYTDIEDNQSIAAVINAYFELLPDQEDGQFDGDATISRAQAMALLMRATTQVNEAQAPEEDADFTKAVGETQYTNFAAQMNEYTYLNTSTGLNDKTFNTTMSRGEYIYLLTKYIYGDTYAQRMEEAGKEDESLSTDVKLTTIKDGGDISLQDAINNVENGLPTDMYQTLARAVALGFITEDNLNWDEAITKSEAITLFIDAVEVYYNTTKSTSTTADDNIVVDDTTSSFEIVAQGDYPDSRSDHQANWDIYKNYFDDFSVYGTDTAGKGLNDLPYGGDTGYDPKGTILQERTTDKGYTVMYDTDTGKVYYSSMILPTGDVYLETESGGVLATYAYAKGYNNCYDITYIEMQEILGVYNGD